MSKRKKKGTKNLDLKLAFIHVYEENEANIKIVDQLEKENKLLKESIARLINK